MLAGPVLQGAVVGPGVAGMRLLVVFDGLGDSCLAFCSADDEELVGVESGLAALLVDVIGGGGLVGVVVTPGGDALVEAECGTFVSAFGDVGLAVEDIYGVVIGEALLAGQVADNA